MLSRKLSSRDGLEAWKSLNSTSRKNPASIDEHFAPMLINNKFMLTQFSSQIQGGCMFYSGYDCVMPRDAGCI